MRNKFIIFITAGIVSLTSFATSASAQDSVNSEVAGPNRVFGGLEWYNSHKNNSSQNLTYNQSIWSGMLGYEYSEREKVYFETIKNEKPIIWTWFKKDFLIKLIHLYNYKEANIISQHPKLINSFYRYDMVIKK